MRDYEQAKMTHEVVDDAEVEVDKDNVTESDKFVLVHSSKSIDGKYMDYLCGTGQTKVVPIGTQSPEDDVGNLDNIDIELLEWLEKKTENSTVYVSFGSEYFLTKEEMEEVAYGLELRVLISYGLLGFKKGNK
ncbi:hypothetical protein RDI58_018137 [Solanum bulbocastanum]|uniref:Uncharacterized protein n=1 Tax=Solanum bulbocastanum TaxID=147425 RepID=A0AAN8TGC4_SOLBU